LGFRTASSQHHQRPARQAVVGLFDDLFSSDFTYWAGLGWDACASWRRAVGVIIDLQIFGAFTNEPTNLKFSKRSIIFASNSCLFVFRVQIRAMSRSRICQFAQSATSATAFILQT